MIYVIDVPDSNGDKPMYPCIMSRLQECEVRRHKNPKTLMEAIHNQRLTKLMHAYQSGELKPMHTIFSPQAMEIIDGVS